MGTFTCLKCEQTFDSSLNQSRGIKVQDIHSVRSVGPFCEVCVNGVPEKVAKELEKKLEKKVKKLVKIRECDS